MSGAFLTDGSGDFFLKKICLIYTGGTIGMVKSEQGYVPDSARFAAELAAIPDLSSPDAPAYDVVAFEPLMDSSDIAVTAWHEIGSATPAR